MRIMNKKGINYIELVISFVLFVGFVIALFVYLNPVRQPNLTEVVIDSVQNNFEGNVTIILTEIPFKVTSTGCITNDTSFLLNSNFGEYDKNKMFIEDDFGSLVQFNLDSGSLIMKTSFAEIYHIFYSNDTEFAISKSSCDAPIIPAMINVSTARSSTIMSSEKLRGINDSYYNDYDNLKIRFDVPALGDFAIKIYNGTDVFFDMTKNIPKGLNVQAREFPVSILDEGTAKRIKAFANIRVW